MTALGSTWWLSLLAPLTLPACPGPSPMSPFCPFLRPLFSCLAALACLLLRFLGLLLPYVLGFGFGPCRHLSPRLLSWFCQQFAVLLPPLTPPWLIAVWLLPHPPHRRSFGHRLHQ